MAKTEHPRWAEVFRNETLYIVETRAGYRSTGYNEQGGFALLPADTDDASLGEAVVDALAKSRYLNVSELDAFNALPEVTRRYSDFVASLLQRSGYKDRRTLFKNMHKCGITMSDGTIVIQPSVHVKLEAWGGTGEGGADHVTLGADAPPSDIGRSLKVAFERCR